MKKRLKKILIAAILLIAACLLYYFINKYTGFAIPCVFHLVTGLSCPGCGISRMFISLLEFDFIGAIKYNAAVFFAMPFMLFLFAEIIVKYIKKGTFILSGRQNIFIYSLIAYFIIFAVIRNIPYFSFLAP